MTYFPVFFKKEINPLNDNFAIFSLFKPLLKVILTLPLLFFLFSCSHYKYDNEKALQNHVAINSCDEKLIRFQAKSKKANHWLYSIVPRHRSQIQWYDIGHWFTWMFFGNDDDGIFGEESNRPYLPLHNNNSKKAILWWIRNPFHNFTHYTIGSAHRTNSELTLLNINCHSICCCQYQPIATKNYGCTCSSVFLALHGGKPFLSFKLNYPWKRKTEFYIGWRKEGTFGIKFRPMVDEKKEKKCFGDPKSSKKLPINSNFYYN